MLSFNQAQLALAAARLERSRDKPRSRARVRTPLSQPKRVVSRPVQKAHVTKSKEFITLSLYIYAHSTLVTHTSCIMIILVNSSKADFSHCNVLF